MSEHASLRHLKKLPKPLVSAKEIREIARKAVLIELDCEVNRLVGAETDTTKILTILEEIKSAVTQNKEENQKTSMLKLEVLRKLRDKLRQ